MRKTERNRGSVPVKDMVGDMVRDIVRDMING